MLASHSIRLVFSSLTYNIMSTEKLIRITTLIPRKKGMSQTDFYKHWTTVHGPMVLDFMMRHGVIEYRQVWMYLPA